MDCRYCGHLNGGHDSNCPKPDTPEMADWKEGHADGRAGMPCIATGSIHYRMGHTRGASAREEAGNGHDPRFA